MRKIAFFAAAAFVASTAVAAPAAAQDDVESVEVDVSGLDPAQDAEEVDRRIAQAARRVCGAPHSRAVTAIAWLETCRATAAARARGR